MREIITRNEAAERGLAVYWTGEPCKRARHLSVRRVADAICIACLVAVMREQMKPNPKPMSLNMHPARIAAQKAGLKTFAATGYPCIHGHGITRFVNGRMACVECNRLANVRNREAAL